MDLTLLQKIIKAALGHLIAKDIIFSEMETINVGITRFSEIRLKNFTDNIVTVFNTNKT